MSKRSILLIGVVMMFASSSKIVAGNMPMPTLETSTPTHTNVICLIPDGMGTAHSTLSRLVAERMGDSLAIDEMSTGLMKTWMSNSLVPGSATCATAFATGYKTNVTRLSVSPDVIYIPDTVEVEEDDKFVPYATVLEAANLAGKSTGVISTSDFRHATPAAYSAHYYYRNNGDAIASQIVNNVGDVILGGGSDKYITNNDCLMYDIEGLLGFDSYVTEGSDFLDLDASSNSRVVGMFADDDLHKDLDRQYYNMTREPSIAEMTEKAIDILSENDDGFFLMVEGSQVDWSSHGDDPVGVTTEFIAFDKAVRVALEFAKNDGNTMVLVLPDHDNGGCALYADDNTGGDSYKDIQMEDMVDPIINCKITADYLQGILFDMGSSNTDELQDTVEYYWPVIADEPMTTEEMDAVVDDIDNGGWLEKTLGDILSKRCYIGWTTGGHTGNDVPIWYYGCDSELGTIDNTDVGKMIFQAMGIDRDSLNARLFVEATDAFSEADGVTIDTAGTTIPGSNPYIVAGADLTVEFNSNRKAVFPLNTRICSLYTDDSFDSVSVLDEGLVVYDINTHRVHVPREAVNLVFGESSPVSHAVNSNNIRKSVTLSGNTLRVTGMEKLNLRFYSLNGALVRNMKVNNSKVNLNSVNLANGVYLLDVNGLKTMKISKLGGIVN